MVCFVSVFIPDYNFWQILSVGSGMGYYSLSGLLIQEYETPKYRISMGAKLGALALITNLLRELLSIILAPILAKYFSKFAPIAAAGVTSIDIALPTIIHYSGKQFIAISIFHGLFFEIMVPLLVTFFCLLS